MRSLMLAWVCAFAILALPALSQADNAPGVGGFSPGYAGEGAPPEDTDKVSVPPKIVDGCMAGGCSGQLCVEAKDGGLASTCEFAAQYACYPQFGECKRQTDGKCGWSKTPALDACLKHPPALSAPRPM